MPSEIDRLVEPWRLPYEQAASVEDIWHCFRLILGRNPNREEWVGHLGHVGAPLPGVVANYLNSLEFGRRGLMVQAPAAALVLAGMGEYRIYASPEDGAVGRAVIAGQYEPHVAALFRRFLRPGMNVIDIGANIGVFALLAAACVGPGGSVLAMEPNPANARLIEASRRVNGFTQLAVCQAAAGAATGLLALHAFDSNGTTSAIEQEAALLTTAHTVAALRVDDLVRGRAIDFVKIDVEGAEYLALLGCADMIGRCHPVIVSEFSPDQMPGISGVDGPAYLAWLFGFGYRVSVIGLDGRLTEPGADAGPIMARYRADGADHIDIACLPPGMALGALT